MNRSAARWISLLTLVLATECGWAATARVARVFILSGQSNARGRGQLAELEADRRAPIPHALIHFGERDWLPLPANSRGKGRARDEGFGVELSFARAMREQYPNDVVAICKTAISVGTPIVAWEKDHQRPGFLDDLNELNKVAKLKNKQGELRHLYNELVQSTKRAIAQIEARDDVSAVHLSGFLWLQNESDVKSLRACRQYQSNLQQLVANLRSDLNAPGLPALVMDFHIAGPEANVRAIKEGLRAAERELPGLRVVSCDGLPTTDGIHFSSQGLWDLGLRFADAYRSMMTPAAPDP
mgnify:CR=1 FL=1